MDYEDMVQDMHEAPRYWADKYQELERDHQRLREAAQALIDSFMERYGHPDGRLIDSLQAALAQGVDDENS